MVPTFLDDGTKEVPETPLKILELGLSPKSQFCLSKSPWSSTDILFYLERVKFEKHGLGRVWGWGGRDTKVKASSVKDQKWASHQEGKAVRGSFEAISQPCFRSVPGPFLSNFTAFCRPFFCTIGWRVVGGGKNAVI